MPNTHPRLLTLPMASPMRRLVSLAMLLTILAAAAAQASDSSSFQISNDALDQWETAMDFYDERIGGGMEEEFAIDGGDENRRSLLWKRAVHYYISYGALSANRIPCPPRSGRSYYTRNCYSARGPVHPYSRGCSAITRCRG